ncbi:hypothetical protein Mal33_36830 [Rosistilla oblonga]|uniref:Uncharacterized protein n=1 Tax=Rosistilla oblonga TaxID=2527990 RepID=A0A518IX58_9BACT|nr:hypothetical protein Mal33_36830 [Rosistilla oblonga]
MLTIRTIVPITSPELQTVGVANVGTSNASGEFACRCFALFLRRCFLSAINKKACDENATRFADRFKKQPVGRYGMKMSKLMNGINTLST